MDLPGPRKADPPVHLRRILVYSTANAAGAAKARARKLATAAGDLDRLVRAAGTRFHPTANAVAARVKAITTKRRAGAYVRTAITPARRRRKARCCRGTSTRPRSTRRPRPTAGTPCWPTLPSARPAPKRSSRRYKGQHVVERRYGEFKGPLAVAPLFLKTNRRIAALITVICLALLIFCLVERQVRKALAPHGATMTGLPGYRLTPARPTGRTISRPSPTCA